MTLSLSFANTPDNIVLTSISGAPIAANTFEGKAILFVNVASRCGYTSQYSGLQELYDKYQKSGLVVVGVPCNQFGGQEPGTAEEIQSFCQVNYGVTFPILEKQSVNGDNRSELYTKLIESDVGGGTDVRWNFEKFLVDSSGQVVGRYPSSVSPNDPTLISDIESAQK